MSVTLLSGTTVAGSLSHPSDSVENERFVLSVNPDGSRSLHTQSYWPDGMFLRDVVQTVDAEWRAVEAYGRLFQDGVCRGTVVRRVVGDRLHSEYWSPEREVDRAEFEAPPNLILGYHPILGDAWKTVFYDLERGGLQEVRTHTVSATYDGSTLGHGVAHTTTLEFLGHETTVVPAGAFETERFMWHTTLDGDLEVWRTGPHHLFVKLIAHDRGRLFQLARLEETRIPPDDVDD
jgi:hypothetical protein